MAITVMTFNLRYDKPDPGDCAWTVRRDLVAERIRRYRPDLIGTQEGRPHQLHDLLERLPEYRFIGRGRDLDGGGEHCAIFYRSGDFEREFQENFGLSNLSHIIGHVSADWTNNLSRMVTWGVFRAKAGGQRLILFNTHLENRKPFAQLRGIQLIRERLEALPAEWSELPVFLTGDFNCEPADAPRQALLPALANGRRLIDPLADWPAKKRITYHRFHAEELSYDSIYYDSRLKLLRLEADQTEPGGICPSDHNTVIGIWDFASGSPK
ncbi:MAG TPA: endonuclease/exonuclease/phosphatase family protein [Gemmataceae bacterium]|jgi:endonuclease/exonuclease/phosphatase family metal-dependent hydrolase|nr:endonuclease/exonuclease/phosphatase family protein [Gemmataceae bacterium]